MTCIDVDECQLDYCDLNALCTNSIGSFDCSCDRGYTGDGIYGSEGCIGRLSKFLLAKLLQWLVQIGESQNLAKSSEIRKQFLYLQDSVI